MTQASPDSECCIMPRPRMLDTAKDCDSTTSLIPVCKTRIGSSIFLPVKTLKICRTSPVRCATPYSTVPAPLLSGHSTAIRRSAFSKIALSAYGVVLQTTRARTFPRSVRVMVGSAPLSDPSNWTFQDIETAWPATNSRANYFSYLTGKYGGVQPDPSSYYFFPRGLTATDSNLYMYALSYANNGDLSSGRVFTTTDGSNWTEISGPTLDAYVSGNKLSNDIRDTFQNHHAIPLNDGRIMTAVWSGPGPVAATTTDQRGLTGWQGSWINQGTNTDIGEPAGFQGPDGVIHAIYRGQGTTKAIWDAYSTDNGSTFTTLTAQDNFSDGPSNKEFGRLPGGSIFYIGDPAGSDTPQGDNRQYYARRQQ